MTDEPDVLFEIKQPPTLVKPPHAIKAVWQYFKIYHPQMYPHKKVMAVCLLCYDESKHLDATHAEVNYGESKSTSKLTQHIKSKHRYLLDKIHYDDEEYSRIHKSSSHSIRPKATSHSNTHSMDNVIQEKLLKWIISTYPSYSFFDQMEWKDLMLTLNNKVEIPTSHTLSMAITQRCESIEGYIQTAIQHQKLTFSIEQFTTCMHDSYAVISVHWIDEAWKSQQLTLACKKLTPSFTLQDMLSYAMEHYRLRFEDVVVIVYDSYSILQQMKNISIHSHVCINSIIEAILQQLMTKEMKAAIQSALHLMSDLKYSDEKLKALKEIQRSEGAAIKEVMCYGDSVWWLLHASLGRLQELKPYLQELDQRKYIHNLNATEWDLIEQSCQIFEPFIILQQYYDSEKYVSISMMPILINKMKERLIHLSDTLARPDILKVFSQTLQQHLEAHPHHPSSMMLSDQIPPMMLFAAALDPRTKSLNGIPEENKDAIWSQIYNQMQEIQSDPEDELSLSIKILPDLGNPRDEHDIFSDLLDKSTTTPSTITYRSCQMELQDYKAEPLLVAYSKKDDVKVYHDPLAWWRDKALLYPRLAVLARKILAIPTTSLASRRAFSSSGRWTNEARAKITHENAASLMFLQDNWDVIAKMKANNELEASNHKRKRSED